MRRLLQCLMLLCLLATPAAAFQKPVTLMADLDGDGDPETVEAYRIEVEGAEDPFDQTGIRVRDTCNGQTLSRKVAGPQDNLATLRLKELDTRGGREIFLDMRSGASGRLGEARVVAWRRGGTSCRRPRALFTYKSERPTSSPTGATREVSFFILRAKALSRRYGGTELVLVEQFLKRGEPGCCGSVRKTTLLRYSRPRDRYVPYRTSVRRGVRG